MPCLENGWTERGLSLTPSECVLLARIDGQTSWSALRKLEGLTPQQVDDALRRWISQAIVVLNEEA